MEIIKKNKWVVILVVAVLAVLVWYLFQTYMVETYPVIKAAPDFEYVNVDGQPVSIENTNGKVRLLYYFYSHCPDVCLPTTHMLSKLQNHLKEKRGAFGEKTAILQVTFDPDRDTTERLQEVAASGPVQADLNGWYFLRGDEEEVIATAKEYGTYIEKVDEEIYAHMNIFVLIDKDGNIRNYYNANDIELDPEDIADDMIRLSR